MEEEERLPCSVLQGALLFCSLMTKGHLGGQSTVGVGEWRSNTLQIFLNDLSFGPYGLLITSVMANTVQVYGL